MTALLWLVGFLAGGAVVLAGGFWMGRMEERVRHEPLRDAVRVLLRNRHVAQGVAVEHNPYFRELAAAYEDLTGWTAAKEAADDWNRETSEEESA